jgi:hypothetical protein
MANPTTNYGFVLPTSSDLVTDLPADFDVALQGVDTRLKALQPGTTLGDLAYSSATANTNTRLAVGLTGQVLTVAGGVPTWATPATTGFVGCGLYRTGVKTIANATATLIDFDAERFDTNGFHDNVTNNTRITIPTGYAGRYLVTWQLGFNFNATGYREIELLINGSQFPQSYNLTTSTGYTTQSAALVYPFSVGDYIQIRATQTSGGNLDSGATQAFLSAVYLGA